MKNHLGILTAVVLGLCLTTHAQRGPRGGGMGGPPTPKFGGAMAKYFGENSNFSANIQMQTKDPQGAEITIPGKIAFAEGKSRLEMNMTEMKGGNMPPQAAAQMKAMGLGEMVVLSRPDKKVSDMIYPGMKAYYEMPLQEADAADKADDYKMEVTEIGKETIDGHPCIKNKAVVTDKEGKKHEATIWNATDLKKFPVKIEQTEEGQHITMSFKNVTFAKPDAAQFEPPAGFAKYDNMQQMMQEIMMKRFGGGAGGGAPAFPAPPTPGQP